MLRPAAIFAAILCPLFALAAETFTQPPEIIDSQVRGEKPTPKKEGGDASFASLNKGPTAQWVWGPDDKDYNFRKTFEASADSAVLIASCDNVMQIKINGKIVANSSEWQAPVKKDITKFLVKGKNEFFVECKNQGGVAGLAVKVALKSGGKTNYLITDKSWSCTPAAATDPVDTKVVGKMGDGPWGNVFAGGGASTGSALSPRDVFFTLPGFQVEKLFTVPKDKLGSWVSIATDDQGRLLASDQGGKGICRITPPPIGSDKETVVEHLAVKMSGAQGMLYHNGGVYFSVNGGPGSGFYRAEAKGDDFDTPKLLKKFNGGGEHGPHAVRLGPDGKSLYIIAGNHTQLPAHDSSRIAEVWQEDLLLPRQWDARGHARGKLAPGGWICKTDLKGEKWEVFSIGYRNPYDMAFNNAGELFAYDADMEWDMGTPWYRPTRVVHATSGSEFGWRSGAGKWPTYYIDSLPPAVNIGPGSPVGVEFGYGAKFPAKYQNALFICDWTFGTMYAVHLKEDGSSYTATKEEFVSRAPLPLTDVAVGSDGALYFTVGGRGTQSELFRVTYVGDESTEPIGKPKPSEARELRHELEALHTKSPANDDDWNAIGNGLQSDDRFTAYAARIAFENAIDESWAFSPKLFSDNDAFLNRIVAIARVADKDKKQHVLELLEGEDFGRLSVKHQLGLLRTYSLIFTRMGSPTNKERVRILEDIEQHFPSKDDNVNRELCRLLVYLKSPQVIEKTLALMDVKRKPNENDMAALLARNGGYGGSIAKMLANQPDLENIHFAYQLRNLKYGWTLDQRRAYFQHLDELATKSGGASYTGFISNIRNDAIANMLPAEKAALESTVAPPVPKIEDLPKPKGPGHKWTVAELINAGDSLKNRNFENGKKMFAAAQCSRCHRFAGEGGAAGPDLTNVASRFQIKDLAEAIVEPSKVISDQYQATNIELKSGKIVSGRITNKTADGDLTVLTDPVDVTKFVEIKHDEVDIATPSKKSLMPAELIDALNEDEVRDLLAYLLSRGNPDSPMFGK